MIGAFSMGMLGLIPQDSSSFNNVEPLSIVARNKFPNKCEPVTDHMRINSFPILRK